MCSCLSGDKQLARSHVYELNGLRDEQTRLPPSGTRVLVEEMVLPESLSTLAPPLDDGVGVNT